MKLLYEDLMSGDVIPVEGVGHIRSPYLRELMPTKGIGTWRYNIYLNVLEWDKESILKADFFSLGRNSKALQNEKLNAFDVATLVETTRGLLLEAMSFFLDPKEEMVWNKEQRLFEVHLKEDGSIIGQITRDNFDEVRHLMLQMNYIGLGEEAAKPTKFTSRKAKELWEQAQKHLQASKAKSIKEKRMELGNIVSKLCAVPSGYTLLNIYDLTVFQLYDQFFQYGYIRAMDLSERAYSIHGGKDFKFENWLDPILKK